MYQNLKETLASFEIEWEKPYYISLERSLFKLQQKTIPINFYAFCICLNGELTLEMDNTECLITKNDFLLSMPSTTIRFKKASPNFKMNVLFFEKNFLLKNLSSPFIIEKTILSKNIPFTLFKSSTNSTKLLIEIMTYLKEKSKSTGKFKDEIIRSIIINLLLEVAEITHSKSLMSSAIPQMSDVFLQFKDLVIQHIRENKSVQFYADKLNISNKYLIEIVKKSSSKTPHEIINQYLVKEAYVLLGNTTLTISQIAFKLQFNSPSAFGRFFKKHTSYSPSEYRNKENLFH